MANTNNQFSLFCLSTLSPCTDRMFWDFVQLDVVNDSIVQWRQQQVVKTSGVLKTQLFLLFGQHYLLKEMNEPETPLTL